MLAPIVEQEINGIRVVREDFVPGGSKRRMLDPFIISRPALKEFVYASPAQGYAQLALAHACRELGRQATIFTAKRKELHPLTAQAKEAGARIMLVPNGYLSNVQAKARAYCEATGAYYVPFGLDHPALTRGLTDIARMLPAPGEVWTAAGSGVLTRALQAAWPDAIFYAVQVGKPPIAGTARIIKAPEQFDDPAEFPPPFPSCINYDAKVWRYLRNASDERLARGLLFWNVAA